MRGVCGEIIKIKSLNNLNINLLRLYLSTSSGNRTHTLVKELDFESSASTNSAIEANLIGLQI